MRNVWSALSTVGAQYQRRQTIQDYPRPSETKQNQLRGQTRTDQGRPGQTLNTIQYHPIPSNTIFIHCVSQMAFFSPQILSSCTSWSHVKNRTELNIKHQAKTQESRYDDDQSGLLTARSKLSEVVYLVAIRAKGSSSANGKKNNMMNGEKCLITYSWPCPGYKCNSSTTTTYHLPTSNLQNLSSSFQISSLGYLSQSTE